VCEVWLAKHYQGEYHVVDELRGAPTLVNYAEQTPPVLVSGAFSHAEASVGRILQR
jgi:hypothetical protein